MTLGRLFNRFQLFEMCNELRKGCFAGRQRIASAALAAPAG